MIINERDILRKQLIKQQETGGQSSKKLIGRLVNVIYSKYIDKYLILYILSYIFGIN